MQQSKNPSWGTERKTKIYLQLIQVEENREIARIFPALLLFLAPLGHAAFHIVERNHPQPVGKRAAHETGHHATEERAVAREARHDLRVRLPGELAALNLRTRTRREIVAYRVSSPETDHQSQNQEYNGNQKVRIKMRTVRCPFIVESRIQSCNASNQRTPT
jgi:hypothetical protein